MDTPVNTSDSDIRNFLVRRLGEKEAEEIMEYINTAIDKEVAEKVTTTKNEIALWRSDMKNTFATKDDYSQFAKKLTRRVSRSEGTLILWSFVFWLTLIIAIIIIFKLIR